MNPWFASQRVQTEDTQVMHPLLFAGQSGIGSHVPFELRNNPAVHMQTELEGRSIKF